MNQYSSLVKVFEDSVSINQVGVLKFPTVRDYVKLGEEKYTTYLYPFRLSLDIFDIQPEHKDNISLFDLFFIPTLTVTLGSRKLTYLELLVESLQFFFNEDVKCLMESFSIRIGQQGMIDRNNFDEVTRSILEITNMEKIKVEPPPEFKSDRHKDIYHKIMEGRSRRSTKDELNMATVINTVMHGSRSFIPYESIKNMTLNQLLNSYKTILEIDSFFINFKQALVGADTKKIDLTHWANKIKLT
ncbi:hypothetical protein [Paenibacillus paeoniae]|uniref:Uncharacterized protein n=1 Tax=Paenibacillus paeoniae TaxID=2292705 RepID=A0A371PJB4_9BACL|nr:hypothetical protein [Paenibacillus paeoniae]REK76308.1 hypothetical protein DX130_04480 [Paenibacillus paeoniae]